MLAWRHGTRQSRKASVSGMPGSQELGSEGHRSSVYHLAVLQAVCAPTLAKGLAGMCNPSSL